MTDTTPEPLTAPGRRRAAAQAPIHPIEVESYQILDRRVDLSTWSAPDRSVVARMIHSTADVGFAEWARIGPAAVSSAIAALLADEPIIVDAAMVGAGAPRLDTRCWLPRVLLAPPGSTRSAAAIALAAEATPTGGIWVVGNAPTALFELISLHERGLADPSAVIGVPVGFVGAAESKAALWASPLAPISITNEGERGGSPVAAAALNALQRLADQGETVPPETATIR